MWLGIAVGGEVPP